ncbi:MAG: flagellar basal body P-ring formation protein FlgA [Rhizobiales bacterium]|nr:flagellar basal body P-ring formation protein FlgA [Hyphomicrobiales bacterium]
MIARAGLVAGATFAASAALAQTALVPTVTIYPRQIIRADMLEALEPETRVPGLGAVATAASEIVGKMSRTTLLPRRPVPLAALADPPLVQIGSGVRLIFRADGLEIRAAGVALQAAAAGERARARNAQTGVVVSGVLTADGSLAIEDGP